MNIPNIPMHTLNNLTNKELLSHIQCCVHPVIESLYSRMSDLTEEEGEVNALENDISEKKLEIDELKNIINDLLDDIAEEDEDMKESQAEALLFALKTKPMTKFEIFTELGIWNSGARIKELRDVGHAIETKMIEHISEKWGKGEVAQYILHEAVEQAA